MNRIGKFLEGKLGTWIIVMIAHASLFFMLYDAAAGALVLSYFGLVIPQLMMYRNAQLAKHIAGEKEDD